MPFEPDVVAAVLRHMNDDHRDDSLAIVRAHGHPDADEATMTGVDEDGGTWLVRAPGGERTVRLLWRDGPVTERAGLREAVVALHAVSVSSLHRAHAAGEHGGLRCSGPVVLE